MCATWRCGSGVTCSTTEKGFLAPCANHLRPVRQPTSPLPATGPSPPPRPTSVFPDAATPCPAARCHRHLATSPNIFYLATGEIVYHAAAVGVVYNKAQHTQVGLPPYTSLAYTCRSSSYLSSL